MDIFVGTWWPRNDHLVSTTSQPFVSESAFAALRNRLADTLRAAITFLNASVQAFGIQSGEYAKTVPAPTRAASTLSSFSTTVNRTLYTALPAISGVLTDAFSSTVAAASNYSGAAADSDYIVDNNGAMNSMYGWSNSTLQLSDINGSFIDVGNSLIGGSGSAMVSIWNNSSVAYSVNYTLIATAVISATNSTYSDETAWNKVEAFAKSVVLGLVILATVVGKFVNSSFNSFFSDMFWFRSLFIHNDL